MGKVMIGKINVQQKNKRGWLVGQFIEEESFRDTTVEICCKIFPVGKSKEKFHKHPTGKEYVIIMKGRGLFRVGEEIVELNEGDYYAISAETVEGVVEIFEEVTLIGIRYPSIPGNKVIIEESD